MKKTGFVSLTVVVLSMLLVGQAWSGDQCGTKPVLTLVEDENGKRLLTPEGRIYTYLVKLGAVVDFSRKAFIVHHVHYGPPTNYDGIEVVCDRVSSGRTSEVQDSFVMYLGAGGGEEVLAPKGYNQCSFSGYVVDGVGTVFTTPPQTIRYNK